LAIQVFLSGFLKRKKVPNFKHEVTLGPNCWFHLFSSVRQKKVVDGTVFFVQVENYDISLPGSMPIFDWIISARHFLQCQRNHGNWGQKWPS
jgi:hypothetical protein